MPEAAPPSRRARWRAQSYAEAAAARRLKKAKRCPESGSCASRSRASAARRSKDRGMFIGPGATGPRTRALRRGPRGDLHLADRGGPGARPAAAPAGAARGPAVRGATPAPAPAGPGPRARTATSRRRTSPCTLRGAGRTRPGSARSAPAPQSAAVRTPGVPTARPPSCPHAAWSWPTAQDGITAPIVPTIRLGGTVGFTERLPGQRGGPARASSAASSGDDGSPPGPARRSLHAHGRGRPRQQRRSRAGPQAWGRPSPAGRRESGRAGPTAVGRAASPSRTS